MAALHYIWMMVRKYFVCLPLLAVSCGPAQNDPGPGGVTVGEAKLLDEAAEMLDERNAPPEPVVQQPATSDNTPVAEE